MTTTLFYTILAVAFSLIAFAIYLLLKPKKEAPKEQTTKYDVLNYQEKERLEEINRQVEKHHELESEDNDEQFTESEFTQSSLSEMQSKVAYLTGLVIQKNTIISLNEVVIRKLKEKSNPKSTIQDATIVNLKEVIESLREEKNTLQRIYQTTLKKSDSYLVRLTEANKLIEQRDRVINLKNIEIKRLKEESQKTPTNFDFNYKVGDVVKGRIIPNGKKYVKGTIVRITRRENLVLDNGKTVDKVDARIVYNS